MLTCLVLPISGCCLCYRSGIILISTGLMCVDGGCVRRRPSGQIRSRRWETGTCRIQDHQSRGTLYLARRIGWRAISCSSRNRKIVGVVPCHWSKIIRSLFGSRCANVAKGITSHAQAVSHTDSTTSTAYRTASPNLTYNQI